MRTPLPSDERDLKTRTNVIISISSFALISIIMRPPFLIENQFKQSKSLAYILILMYFINATHFGKSINKLFK